MKLREKILRISTVALLLAVLVICALPVQNVEAAGGSKQLIIGGYNNALSKTSTEYNTIQGGYSWNSVESYFYQIVSTSGTFSNLSVELSGVPGTNGYIFTLMVNGIASTLTCTVAADGTTSIDSTHTVDVVAGDYITLRSSYSIAPDNTPSARWSTQFESNNSKESLILGTGWSYKDFNCYFPLTSSKYSDTNSTESNAYQVIPTSGKIKNLYVLLTNGDPGDTGTDGYTYTLRINGADTTLTTTITADDTIGNDTTHEVSVSAGDLVTLSITPVDTPSFSPYTAWGLTFESDINHEFIILGQSSDVPTNSQTEYNFLNTTAYNRTWSTTESFQSGQSITDLVLKKFYVKQSAVSGAGKSWTYTVRGGGGSTSLAVTIAGDTDTTGSDTTHTYTPVAYDDLAIMAEPTDSPTAAVVYWGLVGYIPGTYAPVVSTSAASDISAGTYTLNGNLTDMGGTASVDVSFQYGTSTGVYPNETTSQTLAATGTFLSTIIHVEADETIYYRSKAVNDAGTSYGAEQTLSSSAAVNKFDGVADFAKSIPLIVISIILPAILLALAGFKSFKAGEGAKGMILMSIGIVWVTIMILAFPVILNAIGGILSWS